MVTSASSQPTDVVRGWAPHLQAHFFAYQLIATKGSCVQRPRKSLVSSQQTQLSAWNKSRRNSPALRFVLKWEASPGIAGLTASLQTLDMALGIPAWLCGCIYITQQATKPIIISMNIAAGLMERQQPLESPPASTASTMCLHVMGPPFPCTPMHPPANTLH